MSSTPKFSIVMPVYNSAQTLPNSINSIVQQTFKDWELIVVDDGSSDNPLGVIKTFKDPRIRYFKQIHQEIVVARNFGVAQAKGEWIVMQDADDFSMPDRLEKLNASPDADIICHGIYMNIWDEAVGAMCRNYIKVGHTRDLLEGQTMPGVCAFKKSVWEKKPFRNDAKYCFDWMMHLDWWLSGFTYHTLDIGLYEYVRMDNSASIYYEKSGKREQSINKIREIVKNEYGKDVGTGVIPNRMGTPGA